jgi:hypothetical protein
VSKPQNLSKHLGKCSNVTEDIRIRFADSKAPGPKVTTVHALAPTGHGPPVTSITSVTTVTSLIPSTNTGDGVGANTSASRSNSTQVHPQAEWNTAKTQEFHRDLVFFIACANLPFRIVENPAFQNITWKYSGDPPLPSPSTLRNKILNEVTDEIEVKSLQKMKGKMGMGQCDGWTNVAKNSMILILVNVEGKVCPHL